MKMKYLLICSGLFLAIHSFAKDNQAVSLFDQLVNVNKFWKDHQDVALPLSAVVFANDRELIMMHLQLVESTLRKKNTDHLTSLQKTNRSNVLDILHAYWQKGVFPQNIYHENRTPYFIDHVNTACAVGHLIIETGYEDLAQKIALNDNYSLIENLNYPELAAWAYEFGFAIAELKWIQPTYGCTNICEPGTVQHVSCHGLSDGCIGFPPVITGLPGEVYSYDGAYKFDTLSKHWDKIKDLCWLNAGLYKLRFLNQAGDQFDLFYDILDPDPISTTSQVEDKNDCTGSIKVNVSGGISPYSYTWSNGETGDLISNLCPGEYWAQITDVNNCVVVKEYEIGEISGIDSARVQQVKVYPNPAKDQLIIESADSTSPITVINIYNAQGVEVMKLEHTLPQTYVDVAEFRDGVYYVKVSNGTDFQLLKFVKMGK